MLSLVEKVIKAKDKGVEVGKIKSMVRKELPKEIDRLDESRYAQDKKSEALYEQLVRSGDSADLDLAGLVVQQPILRQHTSAKLTLLTVNEAGFFDDCPEIKPLVLGITANNWIWTNGLKDIFYTGEGLDMIGTEKFSREIMTVFVENYGRVDNFPEASLREAVLVDTQLTGNQLASCRGWNRQIEGELEAKFNESLDYYQAMKLITIGVDKKVQVAPIVEKSFESVDQMADDCGPGFVPFNHPMFGPRLALKHRFSNVPLKPYWNKRFNG
ncbi:MAG: hypothetical protein AAB856_00920 [Patescibacteria group bacterium]